MFVTVDNIPKWIISFVAFLKFALIYPYYENNLIGLFLGRICFIVIVLK